MGWTPHPACELGHIGYVVKTNQHKEASIPFPQFQFVHLVIYHRSSTYSYLQCIRMLVNVTSVSINGANILEAMRRPVCPQTYSDHLLLTSQMGDSKLNDPEKETLFRLDSRIDTIGERISKIEGKLDDKASKGFKQKLSESGGLIALFLSIGIGSFTLYDKLVAQPSRDEIQQRISFRANITELSSIEARIAGLDWQIKPQSAMAESRALTPQILALIVKITEADKMMPNVMKFADRLLVAQKFENFGQLQDASKHADLALENATDQIQRANANWTRARIRGHQNKFTEMRELYALTVAEFKSIGLKSMAGSVMDVYGQWISFELSNSECGIARTVFSDMKLDLKNPDVWPQTRTHYVTAFNKLLSNSPNTCELNLTD